MRNFSLVLFAVCLLTLGSCSKRTILVNDLGLGDSTKVTDVVEKYDYYVDEYGNEGVVMSVGSSQVIVISLDETEAAWSQENELVYDVTYSGESQTRLKKFGLDMLNIMCANGIEKYPAQKWCNEKNRGALTNLGSWRLPSYREWESLFGNNTTNQFTKLNKAIRLYGGKTFDEDSHYWTCTEDLEGCWTFANESLNEYDPVGRAINVSVFMMSSTNKDDWAKQKVWKVRAIKYVYYAEYM